MTSSKLREFTKCSNFIPVKSSKVLLTGTLGLTYSKKMVSWRSLTAAISATALPLYDLDVATHSTSRAMYVGVGGVGGSSGGTVGAAGAQAEALDEGVQAEAVPLRLIGAMRKSRGVGR